MYRIGIDLGGTKIEGVVLDASGRELTRKRIPTEREHGYQHILNRLKLMHDDLLPVAHGQPVKADLEKLIGRKIEIQNDANCFAMAEARLGAGKGKKLVFGVIMGTGCGGGIVYHGEVFTGAQAIAG